jgi:hypothetical protein
MLIYSVAAYDFIIPSLVRNWISQRDQTIHGCLSLFILRRPCYLEQINLARS